MEKDIRKACVFLRENNHTIPSEVIEFMLRASLDALKQTSDNMMYIGGVEHLKDNSFKLDKKKHTVSAINHPLGTVYQQGWWGYVANGYDWWRFPILRLKEIIKNNS